MKKNIEQLIKTISILTNKATNKEEAINKEQKTYLHLEYSSHYGGYRLVNVRLEDGGHWGAFGESSAVNRRSAKAMISYLEGLINGIEYGLEFVK